MTKIMLVEDDNNLREIYEARLSAEGYEVVSAQDGEAALAIAGKEKPDMIISDVMMPKISGFEMLDILRNTESLKDVKIIMLTALGQAEDSQRANQLGADRYLVKSQVTLEDIVKAAHELLDTNKTPAAPAAGQIADNTDDGSGTATAPDAAATGSTPATEDPAASSPPAADAAAKPGSIADAIIEPPAAGSDTVQPPTTQAQITTPAAVTSIPVADDSSTDAAQDNTVPAGSPRSAAPATEPTRIEVVEPPEANAEQPSPTAETPDVTPKPGPEPAGSEPPSVAASEEQVDHSAPQAAGDEEATMHAQIADFINNHGDAQAADSSEAAQAAIPATAPDAAAVQPAEAPTAAPEIPETPEVPKVSEAPELPPQAPPATPDTTPVPPAAAASASTPATPISGIKQREAIADFEPVAEDLNVHNAPVITPVSGQPSTPAGTDSAAPAPGDDQLLDSAVSNLSTSAAAQEADQKAADEAAETSAEGKKIISPLQSAPGHDIHQLLAVEEAKVAATQASAAAQTPQPNVAAYNPSATLSQPPAAPQPPPQEPVDPNSIAL